MRSKKESFVNDNHIRKKVLCHCLKGTKLNLQFTYYVYSYFISYLLQVEASGILILIVHMNESVFQLFVIAYELSKKVTQKKLGGGYFSPPGPDRVNCSYE